jgi:regulatory protein
MKKKMGALPYALYLLKMRDRGTEEIRQKMKRKEYQSQEIEEVIKFLAEKKFLDDERFAKNLVKNELLFHSGRYRIKQKMIKLLLPRELIEEAILKISATDEAEIAEELAQKWLTKKDPEYQIQSDPKLREKLARHLVSKGFGWDIVKEAIDKASRDNSKYQIITADGGIPSGCGTNDK